MSPEAQRIAIAEACGWRIITAEDDGRIIGFCVTPPRGPTNIPDYPNDLNAMHEAEKVLNAGQLLIYTQHLHDMTPAQVSYLMKDWHCIHATAAQRAEAFLRAIGKWAAPHVNGTDSAHSK